MIERNVSHEDKLSLLEMDNHKCCKCSTSDNLTVDHIIPVKLKGSTNSLENLQTLCFNCNIKKGQNIEIYSKRANNIKFVKSIGYKLAYHKYEYMLESLNTKEMNQDW